MNWKLIKYFIFILPVVIFSWSAIGENLSPAAIGWGNLLVPGLGATLRGKPGKGLMEAGLELGTYFGGTFGTREGNFSIDGSVTIPTSPSLTKPILGQALQEFGLKYHFFNTFYHYQQVAMAQQESELEKAHLQPLYKGDWTDIMSAPFRWKNLGSPWVFPLIIASGAYLVYNYKNSAVNSLGFRVSSSSELMYGVTQTTVIPLTGAMGEEPLFRGFVMRETRQYTGSLIAAQIIQSSLFTLIHPRNLRLSSFVSGIYFGMMTNHYQGNIEQAIAAHFWVNVIDGVISYWTLRRAQGKNTPFAPPISGQVSFAF